MLPRSTHGTAACKSRAGRFRVLALCLSRARVSRYAESAYRSRQHRRSHSSDQHAWVPDPRGASRRAAFDCSDPRSARRQDRAEPQDERDAGGHGSRDIQVVVRRLRSRAGKARRASTGRHGPGNDEAVSERIPRFGSWPPPQGLDVRPSCEPARTATRHYIQERVHRARRPRTAGARLDQARWRIPRRLAPNVRRRVAGKAGSEAGRHLRLPQGRHTVGRPPGIGRASTKVNWVQLTPDPRA